MADDHHQVPPPTPVGSQVEPTTSVEAAADAAAALVAGALTSGSADEGISGGVDNDGSPDGQGLGCQVAGRGRRGSAKTSTSSGTAASFNTGLGSGRVD